MAISINSTPSKNPFKTILLAGFVAGTLDILGAITVYVWIMDRTTITRLLQGIAGGAFGKTAFEGGTAMAICGLAFHFIIAFSFTIFYFILCRYIPFLYKQKILSGLLYGIFAWMVMNLAVLPSLNIAPIPHKWDAILRGAAILMLCIGLPISLIIGRYYSRT
jgi:uncharacterized membrane protein YagU involved in acid resistance